MHYCCIQGGANVAFASVAVLGTTLILPLQFAVELVVGIAVAGCSCRRSCRMGSR